MYMYVCMYVSMFVCMAGNRWNRIARCESLLGKLRIILSN